MGNRAVCDALKSLSLNRQGRSNLLLHHLVLAAPDIDADTFQEMAAALAEMSGHVTLYTSSKDKAIRFSQTLHGNRRAGLPPPVIVPGVTSIDASQMGKGWLRHSYFTDNWPLLSDIHALLSADTPPAQRFGLREMISEDGVYYVFNG